MYQFIHKLLTRAVTYNIAVTWPHYFWVAIMCATARYQR